MGGEGGGWGGRIKMRKIDELQNGRFLKCVYSLTQFWQLVRQYQVTILYSVLMMMQLLRSMCMARFSALPNF